MKELLDDVEGRLNAHPDMEYVKIAGGVIVLPQMELFPQQKKTPCIVLIDGGSGDVRHLSSRKRWMPFRLEAVVVVRVFVKDGIVRGLVDKKGVTQMTKDVRTVLDMDRMEGKYLRAFLRSEERPAILTNDSIWLQTKSLIFEYVRLES